MKKIKKKQMDYQKKFQIYKQQYQNKQKKYVYKLKKIKNLDNHNKYQLRFKTIYLSKIKLFFDKFLFWIYLFYFII